MSEPVDPKTTAAFELIESSGRLLILCEEALLKLVISDDRNNSVGPIVDPTFRKTMQSGTYAANIAIAKATLDYIDALKEWDAAHAAAREGVLRVGDKVTGGPFGDDGRVVAVAGETEPEMKWKPVETMPRDGRWIIAVAQDGVTIYRIAWRRDPDGITGWREIRRDRVLCSNGYDERVLFSGWIDCPQPRDGGP
jgi:hypothetical protein